MEPPLATRTKCDDEGGEPCHLLSLPPELRLRIYEYYFGEPRPCRSLRIDYSDRVRCWWFPDYTQTGPEGPILPLLCLCRKVYHDTVPVLWQTTKVHIFMGENFLHTPGRKILESNESYAFLKQIQTVNINALLRGENERHPAR